MVQPTTILTQSLFYHRPNMAENKIPSNFRETTKEMSKLIKIYHHLRNTDLSDRIPGNIKKTQEHLIKTITPTFPNAKTDLLKTGYALNWSYTSMQILQEHYQDLVDSSKIKLSKAPKEEWENSLEVAIKWAQKDIKRLSEATIKEASTHILDLLNPTQPTTSTSSQTEQIPIPNNPIQPETDRANSAQTSSSDNPIPSMAPPPQKKQKKDNEDIQTEPKPTHEKPPQPHTSTNTQVAPPKHLSNVLFQTHPHHGNKYRNWTLQPRRPFILMGDSNLSRLPFVNHTKVQVDCFPGANLSHAAHLLKNNTPTNDKVEKLILSFGINNRKISNKAHLQKDLQAMLTAAVTTSPNATIRIPLINHSEDLPEAIKGNIETLNALILQTGHQMPKIRAEIFNTLPDGIHWSPQTAVEILRYWRTFLF